MKEQDPYVYIEQCNAKIIAQFEDIKKLKQLIVYFLPLVKWYYHCMPDRKGSIKIAEAESFNRGSKQTSMTHDEKINYMRMSAGVCGFHIDHKHLDLLVSTYELILEKKGDTSLSDSAKVEVEVKKRDDARNRQALLDKVSEKIS